MLPRKPGIKICYVLPHHLINASALPCETGNMVIVCFTEMFHVDLPIDTEVTSELSPNHCYTTVHS